MAVNISGFGLPTLKGVTDIPSLVELGIKPLSDWIIGFSVVVAVVLIIMAGYNFITSMGEPEKIQKAQEGVTAAIIGLVVVFLARLIVLFILEIVGGK